MEGFTGVRPLDGIPGNGFEVVDRGETVLRWPSNNAVLEGVFRRLVDALRLSRIDAEHARVVARQAALAAVAREVHAARRDYDAEKAKTEALTTVLNNVRDALGAPRGMDVVGAAERAARNASMTFSELRNIIDEARRALGAQTGETLYRAACRVREEAATEKRRAEGYQEAHAVALASFGEVIDRVRAVLGARLDETAEDAAKRVRQEADESQWRTDDDFALGGAHFDPRTPDACLDDEDEDEDEWGHPESGDGEDDDVALAATLAAYTATLAVVTGAAAEFREFVASARDEGVPTGPLAGLVSFGEALDQLQHELALRYLRAKGETV